MDGAIHRNACPVLAGCVPAQRSRSHESTRRNECTPRAGQRRRGATVAGLCCHASVAIVGEGVIMIYYDHIESPCGRMLLVARDDALTGVYFEGQKYDSPVQPEWIRDPDHHVVRQTRAELTEYFAGARKRFDVPLAAEGTSFQEAVWKASSTGPFATTITYAELARRAGVPGSARAAGAATGRNPLTIIVPCHRIIGADGWLTGYAGGLARKRALLALESGTPDLLSACQPAHDTSTVTA